MLRFNTVDNERLHDYFRSFGLACVIGSMRGFFLKPHTEHGLLSIAMFFTIGITISYIGMTMLVISCIILWHLSEDHKHNKNKKHHK